MPQWSDNRIETKVKNELTDLQSVLGIVAQCSKEHANRILQYCLMYVSDGDGVSPTAEETVDGAMEKLMGAVKKGKAA